jgi:hypothetical protein
MAKQLVAFVCIFVWCHYCTGMEIIPGILIRSQLGTNPQTTIKNNTCDEINVIISFICHAQLTCHSIFRKSYSENHNTSILVASQPISVGKRSTSTVSLNPVKKHGIWWDHTHVLDIRTIQSFNKSKGTDHYEHRIEHNPDTNELIVILDHPTF